jgi:hypothetical protein
LGFDRLICEDRLFPIGCKANTFPADAADIPLISSLIIQDLRVFDLRDLREIKIYLLPGKYLPESFPELIAVERLGYIAVGPAFAADDIDIRIRGEHDDGRRSCFRVLL